MGRRIVAMALGCALIAFPAVAHGQQADYPTRPVHVLAAAAPGGNPDVLARLLSQRLAELLGQPFVVENVPGAGGILAAKRIAGSAPEMATWS
jgi:tripartite-type tricarboxylate transporter receptor subunit TctC